MECAVTSVSMQGKLRQAWPGRFRPPRIANRRTLHPRQHRAWNADKPKVFVEPFNVLPIVSTTTSSTSPVSDERRIRSGTRMDHRSPRRYQ